jgi:Domain of unknown function (DUF4349)
MTPQALRALALALLVALVGCAREQEVAASADTVERARVAGEGAEAPALQGQANRADTFLAYEHEVHVRMPAGKIAARVAAVRVACMTRRFGDCLVLAEEQGAGQVPHGRLQVRAVPAAVEALVNLAADGAEVAQRSTRAEDLADAVRDTSLRQRRLKMQHAKLSELAERRDARLDELVSLNQQLAQLEAELQQAEQDAAQHRRRIDTNLLTLHFGTEGVTAESSATREAMRGLGGIWDRSVAVLVTVVGALLPFALFAALVWALVNAVRRARKPRA